MPLIGKKELARVENPDPWPEVVYYNDVTNEIFSSYQEHILRSDFISQPQFSCSVTGRSGLTFSEACESEEGVRAVIHSVPPLLQKVMAYLVTLMKTFSHNVALSLLYEFTNLRYFIGESVQLLSPGRRRHDVFIREVIPPKSSSQVGTISYGLDPLSFEYVVENAEDGETTKIQASRLTRHKGILTREKIRLFIKIHLQIQKGRYDDLVLREESREFFSLDTFKWREVFSGPEPDFQSDTTLLKALGKKEAAEYETDNNENVSAPTILKKKSNILSASKEKAKQYTQGKTKIKKPKKQKGEKIPKAKKTKEPKPKKEKPKINKEEQREMMKKARKEFEENYKAWLEKRDDLLCDDLKALPEPIQVKLPFDQQHLKNVAMTTEFVNIYAEFIDDFNQYFPDGISFRLMQEILFDNEVGGPFGDLVQLMFSTIMNSRFDSGEDTEDIVIDGNLDLDSMADENAHSSVPTNYSNYWVATFFNTHEQLAKLKLDQFSLSEILRIYILKVREMNNKTGKRAPLSDGESRLVKNLSTGNFFELDIESRLDLFSLLISDIFTLEPVINKIEETNMDIYKLKIEIRHLNAAHTKWLREHPIRLRIRKKKGDEEVTSQEGSSAQDASQEEKETYRLEKIEREERLLEEIGAIKAQIRKLSSFSRVYCLGTDRAFRKYWVFHSIPGIFIEKIGSSELEFSCFESPVPQKKPVMAEYLPSTARRRKESQSQGETNSIESEVPAQYEAERCTGDMKTCTIHGTDDQTSKWFVYTKEQFLELIDALNNRGIRESELKSSLEYERKSIITGNLAHFDPKVFNPDYSPPSVVVEVEDVDESMHDCETRKSKRIQHIAEKVNHSEKPHEISDRKRKIKKSTLSKYLGMDSLDSHFAAFRDELADLAERVIAANFSTFNETHWKEWKDKLASVRDIFSQRTNAIKQFITLLKGLAMSLKSFCLLPPLSVTLETNLHSPSDKENIEHSVVKENVISEKWLELLKLSQQLEKDTEIEMSYGISTISQLFVNFSILDKSINWELSVEKIGNRCKLCKRKIAMLADRLVCDRCNRGFHSTCLKIRNSEEYRASGWSCYDCEPRSSVQAPAAPEPEEVNTILYNECGFCNYELKTSDRDVRCHDCETNFHLVCTNLTRVPRGAWSCKKCAAKQKKRTRESTDSYEDSEVRRSSRKRKALVYSDDDDDDFDLISN